jgi:ATP-binding cassette subfamily B protein
VAALALGLVAALLGMVIGPALQVLIVPDRDRLLWSEVLGPVWAGLFHQYLGADGIQVKVIYFYLPMALVVVATLKSFLTIWQWYTWEWLGEQIAFRWRQDLVAAFVALKPELRDQSAVAKTEEGLGGLMTQDIRTCRDYVVHFFGGLPREGFQAIFMAISIAALSPKLFFVFAVCLAPVVALLSRLGRKIRRRSTQALEDNSVLGEWIQQRLLGVETIKQYGTEDSEIAAMKSASENLFHGFLKAARSKARTGPIIEILGITAMCVALGVAFSEISTGRISGAVAMSFFASLALFAQSAAKLGRYFNSNREGVAAAARIFSAADEFKKSSLDIVRPIQAIEASDQTRIDLNDVSVNYGTSVAVDRVTLTFEAGRVYCIVGSSGAGKSSLFAAILGLVSPGAGCIKYSVDQTFAGGLDISYMPQSVTTFPGSIAENVAYPNSKIDLLKVEKALDAVGFRLDTHRLTKGLETLVGPGELQLSGGEAQRLQLARLMYHRSPYILIDEGTSALDPGLEKLVLTRARELAKAGSVVIMIAHRPAAVDFADEVVVMHSGRVVRVGSRPDVTASHEFRTVFV